MLRTAEWFGAAAVVMLACAIPLHVFGDGSKWEGASWILIAIFGGIAGVCAVGAGVGEFIKFRQRRSIHVETEGLAELLIEGRQILAFEPSDTERIGQPQVAPYADQYLRLQYNDWHRKVYELLRSGVKWGSLDAEKFRLRSVAVKGEGAGFYRRLQAQLEFLETL